MANGLLFASVYLLAPLLLTFSMATMGVLLMFLAGMWLVGPFNAYLEDAYSRKGVLMWGILLLSLGSAGHLLVSDILYTYLLALIQGCAWGVIVPAGITISIDVTASKNRTQGNVRYALSGRVGMMLGVVLGFLLQQYLGTREVVLASVACSVLAFLLVSPIYLIFHAPIGEPLMTLDRFLLPRAWLPALNVVLKMFGVGLVMPMLICRGWDMLSIGGLLLAGFMVLQTALSSTRMFVNLSAHCERSSANTTCQIAMETGLLGAWAFYAYALQTQMSHTTLLFVVVGSVLLSLLLFLIGTFPYYKHQQRRKNEELTR